VGKGPPRELCERGWGRRHHIRSGGWDTWDVVQCRCYFVLVLPGFLPGHSRAKRTENNIPPAGGIKKAEAPRSEAGADGEAAVAAETATHELSQKTVRTFSKTFTKSEIEEEDESDLLRIIIP